MLKEQIRQEIFDGYLIRYNTQLNFFNATDLLNLYKKNQSKDKRIQHFMELQFTKKWLIQNGGRNKHVFANRGKYGGTWVSKDFLIQFNNWLKSEQIDEYMRFENKFMEVIIDLFRDWFTLELQYKVGMYRLDAYISELNLAIEYDEPHHASTVLSDKKREKFIKNKLKCSFIRVKQGQEMQGIREIMKHLINSQKP